MADEGPTTVGSIDAKIGAVLGEWTAAVARVKEQAAELRGEDPKITVKAEVADALAKMSAVEAAQSKLDQSSIRLQAATESLALAEGSAGRKAATLLPARLELKRAIEAQAAAELELAAATEAEAKAQSDASDEAIQAPKHWQAIAGAVLAVIALLGPLAAGATAVAGGLTGMGAAGVLAILGIKRAMQDGTTTGNLYGLAVQSLQRDLEQLENSAAAAMLYDFLQIEQDVTAAMPQLSTEVAQFSGILGDAASTAVPAIIDGLKKMNPLFVDGANMVRNIAQAFADWESGDGMSDFVAYAQAELPRVERATVSLTRATVDLGEAWTPIGNDLLQIVDSGGKVISLYSKLTKAADGLNVSLTTGNKDLDGALRSFLGGISGMDLFGSALTGVSGAIDWVNGLFDAGSSKADKHSKSIDNNTLSIKNQASQYGLSVSAYKAASDAQQQTEDQTKATTAAMFVQGDAAGLLKQQLDLLNGKTLNAAQAQNQFDSQIANMSDHLNAAGNQIDRANALLTGNTAAAVANRGELIALTQAAENNAQAFRDNGGSADATKQKLIDMKQAIIDNAVAHGEDKDQVQAFVDTIFKIPTTIPLTKIDVDASAAQKKLAELQKYIQSFNAQIVLNIATGAGGTLQVQRHAGGGTIGGLAGGGTSGTVFGPGTATSDSVLTRLSVGEEVIKASSASQVRPFLKQINADPMKAMSQVNSGGSVQKHYHLHIDGTGANDDAIFAEFQRRQNLLVA